MSWEEFSKGKRSKVDVQEFERDLEQNIFGLSRELLDETYKHGEYSGFYITDPKRRHIHKATVRDRVLHHALFNILNPVFEPTFIETSYSCRIGKGNHKGVEVVDRMLRKVSKNNTIVCYALKCDVQKFFDNVDHQTLISILGKRIKDGETMNLLQSLITSYQAEPRTRERERERE